MHNLALTPLRSAPAPAAPSRSRSSAAAPARALFGWGESAEDKARREEQWAAQQEVLRRRKTGAWRKDMDERRGKVSRYNRDPAYKKAVDEERRARVKAEKEAADAARGPARFIIPLPVNPIGMPEYDNGERFDLRLPYVDNGWVDEDADVMGKLGRWLTGKGGKSTGGDEQEGKGGGGKKGRK